MSTHFLMHFNYGNNVMCGGVGKWANDHIVMCDHISYAEKSKGVDPPGHKYRRFPGGMTAGAPESNQIFHVDLGYVWNCGGRCYSPNGARHSSPVCPSSHSGDNTWKIPARVGWSVPLRVYLRVECAKGCHTWFSLCLWTKKTATADGAILVRDKSTF